MVWVQVKNRAPSKMNEKANQTKWWNKLQPHKIMDHMLMQMQDTDCALPSLSVMLSMNLDHTTPVVPDMSEVQVPPLWKLEPFLSEDQLRVAQTKFEANPNRRLSMWEWILNGNVGKRVRANQYKELVQELGLKDGDAIRSLVLEGKQVTLGKVVFVGVLMSEVIDTLYTSEDDKEAIQNILTKHVRAKLSPFDREGRMSVIKKHISELREQLLPASAPQ